MTMSERQDYLAALAGEIDALGGDVEAMLAGRLEVDPIVLLDVIQTAALALQPGVDLGEATLERARGIVASARRAPGKDVLGAAFDALDLDALLTVPATDSEQLEDWVHDLFELGFLVDVLTGARKARLVEALGLVAGEVMTRDDLEALYEPAFFLSGIAELPDEHPVAELLDAVLAATDWVTRLEAAPLGASVAAVVAAARAKYEAGLSPVARLVRWGRERWGALAEGLFVPARAFAASARALPVWPAPRVVLGRKDDVEVALVVDGDNVTVEVDGGPDFEVEGTFEDGSLVVVVGDWRVDMAAAELVAADYPWKPRLATVAARAPGAVRAELLRQASVSTSASLRRDLERQAAIAVPDVPEEVGQATFVLLPEDGSPGFFARATSGGFHAGVVAAGDEVVARWLAALVGDPTAAIELDVRLQTQGVVVEGDSWQLAAALAVISERLAAPRRIVASGLLGPGVGEVSPAARQDDKEAVVAAELGPAGAEVLFIVATGDVRPELARIFGDDWQPRLAAALGVSADASARAAMKAWRRFWWQRNALEAGPLGTQALRHAQAALAAGVSGVHAIEARWVEAACLLHSGLSAQAHAGFERVAADIAATEPKLLPALLAEELLAYRGIALVDLGQPAAAVALLQAALVALDAALADGRIAGDRRAYEVRLQLAGSLQRACAFAGELDEARWLLLESLERGLPAERARTLADLAEVERRRGDDEAARRALAEAREALDDIDNAAMARFTERFVRVYEARAGVAPSVAVVEPPGWALWPQPIEVLEALLVGPNAALVAWVDAYVRDDVALIHRLTVLGALCRAALAGREVLAVMTRLAGDCAKATLPSNTGDAPELAALLEEVARGEPEAIATWAARCPY